MNALLIEGVTSDEIASLSPADLRALLFPGRSIVFHAGSATLLGEFAERGRTLVIELAHIDDGGEGVLPALAALIERVAHCLELDTVEWLVYATNCARPNPKLRRVLERKAFEVRDVPGKGECYYKTAAVRRMDA